MDGRHLKILTLACVGLVAPGLGSAQSQEPGGPGFRGGRPLGEAPGARMGREQEAYRRLEQLPPEERETFKRNLEVWRGLPPEERQALRNMAHAHAQVEIDKAMQESGLHLDQDQRELFSLRYKQERRKLERDLQNQAAAERARRMPEIMNRLRSEFGGANGSARPTTSSSTQAKPEASAAASPATAPSR